MPQVRILTFELIKKTKTHNPRSPPEEMSETPHDDTNSGRTGSGVEVKAIGCSHAVGETGLSSSSTCAMQWLSQHRICNN